MPRRFEVPSRSAPVRWLAAFARFWVDFLIGDTPELFVGAVVAVGAAAAVVGAGARGVAVVVLPVLVLVALAFTLLRAYAKR